MSLQGTIVPGRLRSELCPWGVKSLNLRLEALYVQTVIWETADLGIKTNINIQHGQIGSHNSLNVKSSHYGDFQIKMLL